MNSLTGPRSGNVNSIPSARDDSSTASGSSGLGSLKFSTKNIPDGLQDPSTLISSIVTDSGISESSELTDSMTSANNFLTLQQLNNNGSGLQTSQSILTHISNTANGGMEQGHSRNSSNTSQVSSISVWNLLEFLCFELLEFIRMLFCRCPKDQDTVAIHKVNTHDKAQKVTQAIRGKSQFF